jgi:hypothetical protein
MKTNARLKRLESAFAKAFRFNAEKFTVKRGLFSGLESPAGIRAGCEARSCREFAGKSWLD